jgi:hypothetical protein
MPYAEVLNRELVLRQLTAVKAAIEKHLAEEDGELEFKGEKVSPEQLCEALTAINESLEREQTSGPGRDDDVFIPRDPIISCLQYGIEQGVEASQRAGNEMLVAEDEPLGDLVDRVARMRRPLPAITDQHIAELGSLAGEEMVLGDFSPFPGDLRWSIVPLSIAWSLFHRKYSYNKQPANHQLPNEAVFFLFSDWGTGIPRAVDLSGEIHDRLTKEGPEQHVIHLGDVYFAGWPDEYRHRALEAWPVRPDELDLAHSWNLCGNHDMYSGGKGYYETCLADRRFSSQRSSDGRPTSIFEMSNEHWRVLGLDTGWEDHDLWPEQEAWLKRAIIDASKQGQDLLLLSHHQLFSSFKGHIEHALREKLSRLLCEHQVRVWFWGHEHRCTIYGPTPEVHFASCIGNGGVPAPRTPPGERNDSEPVELDYEEIYAGEDGGPFVKFAFVMLELSGRDMKATYIDEEGHTIRSPDL